MLILRRISLFAKINKNFYSNFPNPPKIIKEIVKNVNSFSNIKITSSIGVKIRPYDVHDCPDSNILRARISSVSGSGEAENVELDVKVNEKNVEVISKTTGDNQQEGIICLLELPIKSDLDVHSTRSVSVAEMYSDHIRVQADENVTTKNLRSTSIDLTSKNGDVNCDGLTLAHKMDIHTENNGNIFLDKLQGDLMHCKTFSGNIATKSCYVENSKFVTESGKLNLKNIHKNTEIYILKSGDLDMTGINGNVYIKTNGGDISLQFSEITGDNIIMANDSNTVTINIADIIEQTSFIEIHSDKIILNDSVSHLSDCLENENSFRMGREESNTNKLLICTKGTLTLGKMSWADTMKQMMGLKDQ